MSASVPKIGGLEVLQGKGCQLHYIDQMMYFSSTHISKIVEQFLLKLSQNTHPRPTSVIKKFSTNAQSWQCLKQL